MILLGLFLGFWATNDCHTLRPTGEPEGRGSLRDVNIEQNSIVVTETGKNKVTVMERN